MRVQHQKSTPWIVSGLTVNESFAKGLNMVLHSGREGNSRNGPVFAMNSVMVNTYLFPEHRVLFHPGRDANPFFHVMEAFWMLAGRRDVALPSAFASNMGNFSVDGDVYNAAYGYRWRHNFGIDQLRAVVEKLLADPGSRQVVVQIWDANLDLVDSDSNAKDKACNISVVFTRRAQDGINYLDMMVSNRSNDLIWGAYGANHVHFSFMHEFVCAAVGMFMGTYTQVSANAHVYTEKLYGDKLWNSITMKGPDDSPVPHFSVSTVNVKDGVDLAPYNEYASYPYARSYVYSGMGLPLPELVMNANPSRSRVDSIFEMLDNLDPFMEALLDLMSNPEDVASAEAYATVAAAKTFPFCQKVLLPMTRAYAMYKKGGPGRTRAAHYILQVADAAFAPQDLLALDAPPIPKFSHNAWVEQSFDAVYAAEQADRLQLDWFRAGSQWLARRVKTPPKEEATKAF